jgi:hypothetical protein
MGVLEYPMEVRGCEWLESETGKDKRRVLLLRWGLLYDTVSTLTVLGQC